MLAAKRARQPFAGAGAMPSTKRRAPQELPVSPPSTPSPGERLKVLHAAKVRTGCAMSSPEAPDAALQPGDVVRNGQLPLPPPPAPPSRHPANRRWPRRCAQVEVVEAVVNENGVVRVKFDGGWVSLRTGAGEQLLEPAEPETEETKLLDELIDLYKEKNGKDPTDEEVKQWITTLKDASSASDAAAPAAGLPPGVPATPATSPAKPAAAPAFDLGAQLGSKGDLFGLDALKGQAHLKASDLGLPSFGVQKATDPAAAAPAAAAAQHSPYAQEMLALNTQFQGWVSEQLQLPGAPHDLSPGLRNYLSHAEALQRKHAAQQQPSGRPPPASPQPAQPTAAKDPAQTEAEAKAAQEAEEAEAQEKAIVRPPATRPSPTPPRTPTHHRHHHHSPPHTSRLQDQAERLTVLLGMIHRQRKRRHRCRR